MIAVNKNSTFLQKNVSHSHVHQSTLLPKRSEAEPRVPSSNYRTARTQYPTRMASCRRGPRAAHIQIIPPSEASPELQSHYQAVQNPDGGIDNIMAIHSLNPSGMSHHDRLYKHIMRDPSPLSRVEREVVAVAVSVTNHCTY